MQDEELGDLPLPLANLIFLLRTDKDKTRELVFESQEVGMPAWARPIKLQPRIPKLALLPIRRPAGGGIIKETALQQLSNDAPFFDGGLCDNEIHFDSTYSPCWSEGDAFGRT